MPYDATVKRPGAVLDYQYDWTPFLEGDTISSSSFPNFPTGLTLQSTTNTTTVVNLWLSGGTKGQDYPIINRIVTTGGRTMEWRLVVRVAEYSAIPPLLAPPYASVEEHQNYTAQAEGEAAFKVEMVALDASDIVQSLVPRPISAQTLLTQAMDATQDTLAVSDPYPYPLPWDRPTLLPESGDVLVELELISYSGRVEYSTLSDARRGMHGTTAVSHASGAVVKDVGYQLRARRAELAVFEWLFLTRGWRPSRSGVLGSESYQVGTEVHEIVRQIMGPYYGRKGGAIRKSVAMSSFPRRRGSSYDWQKGWYNV